MFPLDYMRACRDQEVIVQLRNGDICHGLLSSCDTFMNFVIQDVIVRSIDGSEKNHDKLLVRGNNVTFVSMPHTIADFVSEKRKEQTQVQQQPYIPRENNQQYQQNQQRGRGRGGRGRGGRGGRGGYNNNYDQNRNYNGNKRNNNNT